MSEDATTVQLRRNASKQIVSRPHLTRTVKGNKGSSTRLHKYNTGTRRSAQIPRTQSTSSISSLHNGATTMMKSANAVKSLSSTSIDSHLSKSPRSTKTGKAKVNNLITVGAHGGHLGHSGHLGHNGHLGHRWGTGLKGVLMLERDDDEDEDDNGYDNNENDYEDMDDSDDASPSASTRPLPVRSDSQLSVGIRPMEPIPPKLSDETVISVTSVANMASALKGAREHSGFVGNDDLISTAVNRSKDFGEMAQMVHGWNPANKRLTSAGYLSNYSLNRTDSSIRRDVSVKDFASYRDRPVPGEDDPREFEKVFREYTNSRAILNPVINSLYRLSLRHSNTNSQSENGSSGSHISASKRPDIDRKQSSKCLQLPSNKSVTSLVATTTNQISDISERECFYSDKFSNSHKHGVIESMATRTLNKLWHQGMNENKNANDMNECGHPKTIQSQAMRVQQQLVSNREKHASSTSNIRLA